MVLFDDQKKNLLDNGQSRIRVVLNVGFKIHSYRLSYVNTLQRFSALKKMRFFRLKKLIYTNVHSILLISTSFFVWFRIFLCLTDSYFSVQSKCLTGNTSTFLILLQVKYPLTWLSSWKDESYKEGERLITLRFLF